MSVDDYTLNQIATFMATLADRISYEQDSAPKEKLVTPVINLTDNFVSWILTLTDAEKYNAKQQSYRTTQRKHMTKQIQHEWIIYEPGKCIKCGLCVHIAERAKEQFGMTFIGRGFNVEINVPLGRDLAAGLKKVAQECVDACPTGALAMKRGNHEK